MTVKPLWQWQPNPGSDAARHVGCVCPVLDNSHGRGDGPFWVREDCPLHGAVTGLPLGEGAA